MKEQGLRELAWMLEALTFGNWHRETRNSWGIGFCQTISCHLQTLGLKQVVYLHPAVTSNVEVRLESTAWGSSGHVTACKALSGAARCWLLPCGNNSAFSSPPLVNEAFRASQQGITHRFVYNPQNNSLVHCQRLRGVCGLAGGCHLCISLSLGSLAESEPTEGWQSMTGHTLNTGVLFALWTWLILSFSPHPPNSCISYRWTEANPSLLLSSGDGYHFAAHLCLTVVPQTCLRGLFLIFFKGIM